tara:strand:- start:6998 stop:7846 length:849 start_codon:yes stop_codon:yes gene_type:complete
MKLFITGGTGFIGKHLVNLALNQDHEVTVLSRKPIENIFKISKNLKNIILDIKDIENIDFEEYDVLINLAAVGLSPRITSWSNLVDINILSALKICQKAKQIGARFIQIGSFCEYGISANKYIEIPVEAPLKPTFAYAASKATSYQMIYGYCISENIELAYLRLFNVYGEGQYEKNIWPALKKSAFNNENFSLTPGAQVRDFISVKDVARIILKISTLPSFYFTNPLVLNVGSGNPTTVLDFCKYWWKKWGAKGKLIPGDFNYRKNEVMRYVPYIEKDLLFK